MKFRHLWLAALVCGFICAACFTAVAAESGEGDEKQADEPAAEKAEGEKVRTPLEQRLLNLYDALVNFTNKHNHRTPRRINQLTSYLKEGEKGLINPETEKKLEMNPKMRDIHEALIENPKKFITFYAEKDTNGKGRAVVFGDKTLKYLDTKEFRETLAASAPKRLTPEERYERMEPEGGGRPRSRR